MKELTENGSYLAAVGKLPEGVSLDELSVSDVVASSFPGFADSRYDAVHIALNGYLEAQDVSAKQSTEKVESHNLIDPRLAAEVAIGGLRRALSART